MNIALVVARFNPTMTATMKQAAITQAKQQGMNIVACIDVPGVFELPLGTQHAFKTNALDGVATLGVVVKGKTHHDQVICHATAHQLQHIALQVNKPVSFGVIGPNATKAQAQERLEEYAKRAIDTLKAMNK